MVVDEFRGMHRRYGPSSRWRPKGSMRRQEIALARQRLLGLDMIEPDSRVGGWSSVDPPLANALRWRPGLPA